MEYKLQDVTNLTAIAGDTNQSYAGDLKGKKVFLKRDSTPFFVAVASTGLAPQLIWTQTIEGHFWVAQEWITGRVLKKKELSNYKKQAMEVLKELHNSDYLALMLYRLQGQEMEPIDFLQEYYWQLPSDLENDETLKNAYISLENSLPNFDHFKICACHGDVNHKNWIFKDEKMEDIYLIDWDSAILADTFCDLGALMYRYVEPSEWKNWLKFYGEKVNAENFRKLWWYGEMQQLIQIRRQYEKGRMQLVKEEIEHLKKMIKRKEQYYAREK